MSGTSLDGLDIAYCRFEKQSDLSWKHSVIQTETKLYPKNLQGKLAEAVNYSGIDLLLLDKELGAYFADSINQFLEKHTLSKAEIDAVASHGHTIFHQPEKGLTYQIACGETIAAKTGIPVINDFRTKDVVSGGQGAPLVPIGDSLLYNDLADSFLNIGGISNICFVRERITAFDICPGNLPLNKYAGIFGVNYDKNGELASHGTVDEQLLAQLDGLDYYRQKPPKSLGIEWLNKYFYPCIKENTDPKDVLRTTVEHIASKISETLHEYSAQKVLVTGGGANNVFLMNRLKDLFDGAIIIPDPTIVEYKESVIFGFLGALYLDKSVNSLSSVTGAEKNNIGGVLHIPGC